MFQWKVAHYAAPTSVGGQALSWWCKQIEDRSGGCIRIKTYFSEELVEAKEMLGAVQSRVADAAYVAIARYPDKLPFSNVCYIPFLPPSRVDHQVLTMNELVKRSSLIREELDRCNVVYGYNYSSPYYNLMGNKPIRTVDDLRGVKVKALPATGKIFEKFGAIPIVSPILETNYELETGSVDIINFAGPVSMYEWKFYKASKYYVSGVDLGGSRSMMLINKDSWNALPDDIKSVVEDLRFEFARTLQSLYSDPQRAKEALDAFNAVGLEIIEFPPEERAKLVAAAADVQEDWVERNGGESARRVLETYLTAKERVIARYPDGIM